MRTYAFFETEKSRAKPLADFVRGSFGTKVQAQTITAGPFAYGVVVITNNDNPEAFGELFSDIRSLPDVKTAFRCIASEDLSRA